MKEENRLNGLAVEHKKVGNGSGVILADRNHRAEATVLMKPVRVWSRHVAALQLGSAAVR